MPRIDPKQLLKTLGVLLSDDGGIKSKDEVARLAQLMQKFSKKLVSKCIYVHILRATEPSLLEAFLSENGWDLINQWFTESLRSRNLALSLEILGLFLVCPMTKALLKDNPETNNAPRLINHLRKDAGSSPEMRESADKVYRKWVLILDPSSMKGGNACALRDSLPRGGGIRGRPPKVRKVAEVQKPLPKLIIKVPPPKPEEKGSFTSSLVVEAPPQKQVEHDEKMSQSEEEEKQACKEDIKAKEDSESMSGGSLSLLQSLAEEVSDNLRKKEEDEVKQNTSEPKADAPAPPPAQVPRESDSSSTEELKKNVGSKKSSPPPSSRGEENSLRKKIKRDRPHHPRDEVNDDQKQHIKALAKKLKEEAQAKKDKETLKAFSGEKMGRIPKIPKKAPSSEPEKKTESMAKKPSPTSNTTAPGGTKSFSDLLVGLDAKPKTVKTPLNRNKTAALLEGLSTPKPSSKSLTNKALDPKARLKDKKSPLIPPPPPPPKKDAVIPPLPPPLAKKESNGLTMESSKPKKPEAPSKKDTPNFHESTSFMDAIFSSMGQAEVPRKKKRRLSDKDESTSPKQAKPEAEVKKKSEEAPQETTPVFSFYRDTLEDETPKEEEKEEESKAKSEEKERGEPEKNDDPKGASSPPSEPSLTSNEEDQLPFEEPSKPLPREVKGILVYHRGLEKRNKAISWKSETELTAIRYFELDETERVNVNKLKYDFSNMRKREFELDKAALMSKGSLEGDVQEQPWVKPQPITVDNRPAFTPGQGSKERGVQALREAEVLQAIYFSKESVPESPAEPDFSELYDNSASPPVRIPLDDKEGIPEESVKDFSQGGWPTPKVNEVDAAAAENPSFSLPPSLSNFLSSIGGVAPPNSHAPGGPLPPPINAGLSPEEQSTFAAQAVAMQKMGMVENNSSQPEAFPSKSNLLPHPMANQHSRPPPHMMLEPPPKSEHFIQHNGGPPTHPPPPPFGGMPNNMHPPPGMPPMNNNNSNDHHHHQNNNSNDFHPNHNFQHNNNNNHHPRHPPPPHNHRMHHHHPYGGGGGGRGYHNNNNNNGGHRGGGRMNHNNPNMNHEHDHRQMNNNNNNNGFRPKEQQHPHHDNRDFRDRSRDMGPQQQQPPQHMMGGRRICKFFAQRGHCRDGERCRFLHNR